MRNRIREKVVASSARAVLRLLVFMVIATMPLSADTITFTDNFTPSASPLWNNYAGD